GAARAGEAAAARARAARAAPPRRRRALLPRRARDRPPRAVHAGRPPRPPPGPAQRDAGPRREAHRRRLLARHRRAPLLRLRDRRGLRPLRRYAAEPGLVPRGFAAAALERGRDERRRGGAVRLVGGVG